MYYNIKFKMYKINNYNIMTLYYISIESVFNQGTGNYFMITNEICNANIFRQELLKKKNFLLYQDKEDLYSCWEFHECIYIITDKKKKYYKGYCIADNVYQPNKFNKLKNVNWNKKYQIIKKKMN